MYEHTYVRTYERTYVHTYAHMYVRTYVCTYVLTYVSTNVRRASVDPPQRLRRNYNGRETENHILNTRVERRRNFRRDPAETKMVEK